MRLRSFVPALALHCAVAFATGCGASDYEVVRVHAGRARVGRFVSSGAYSASLQASIAEARGDWPRAVDWLIRARDEDPDGPELQARLGLALCHVGKLQAGIFAINDALRVDPDLERAWTNRGRCRLMSGKTAEDRAAARADFSRALEADGDAVEPALLLIELDLRDGALAKARTRAEELVVLHPTDASAWRALAEVSARQGDGKRAIAAATAAATFDDVVGAQAKSMVRDVVDKSGVASWSLSLRSSALSSEIASEDVEGPCSGRLRALEDIAAKADPKTVAIAADGVRSACPELDGAATLIEAQATWSVETADDVEARALSAPSSSARRWAARMRLRRKPLEVLLEPDALPRADDRATLAIVLAAAAAAKGKEGVALAAAALDLAPAEPTVARLCAEVARVAGRPKEDPWRRRACLLARTPVEMQACGA